MTQFAKETLPISLEEEMRRSYLDYAMSVIVGRALPDARDGSQAGAPARAVCHARAQQRLEPAIQKIGPYRG
jgi:DNA gyrase/topoisomerase IV subunit A